jgi:hypothetical protein
MFRLAMMLFAVIGSTLAGTAVIAVLVAGYTTLTPILIAAGIGALVAIPATWFIARLIYEA